MNIKVIYLLLTIKNLFGIMIHIKNKMKLFLKKKSVQVKQKQKEQFTSAKMVLIKQFDWLYILWSNLFIMF